MCVFGGGSECTALVFKLPTAPGNAVESPFTAVWMLVRWFAFILPALVSSILC